MTHPRQTRELLDSENCIISSAPRPNAMFIQSPYFFKSGKICMSYIEDKTDTEEGKTTCIVGKNVKEIWNPDDGTQKPFPQTLMLSPFMSPNEDVPPEEKAFHKPTELQRFHECLTHQVQQDHLHCSDFLNPNEIVTVKSEAILIANANHPKKYDDPGHTTGTRIEFYLKQESEYKLTGFIPSEKSQYPVTVVVLSPNKFITATLSNQFHIWDRKDAASEFKKIDDFDLFAQTWQRCKLGKFHNDVDAHCYRLANKHHKQRKTYPINPHYAHLYALSSTEVLYLQCRSMSNDFQLIQKIDIVNKRIINQLILDPKRELAADINTSMIQLKDGKTFFCFYTEDNVRSVNRVLDTETMSLYSLPRNCGIEPYSNQLSKTGAILSANQRNNNCELYLFPHIAVYNNNVQLEIALHVASFFIRQISRIIAEYVGGHDVIVSEKDKIRLSANLFSLYGAPIATSQGSNVMNSSEFGCELNFKDKCRKKLSLI